MSFSNVSLMLTGKENMLRRIVATVSVMALFLNVLPLNQVKAAANGFSFEGFRLTAPASYVGVQQSGTGDFASGNAANAGEYAEGMCVPLYLEAENTTGAADDYEAEIEFDHYRSQTGVIGYMALETVTTSLSDVSTADDLSDFTLTGADLTTLTSITPVGSALALSVLVEGPFNGSDAPLTNTDSEGYYRVTVNDLPAGETVQVPFCARLSDNAGQYGNGSNLHIGMGQGGGQIPASPEDFQELPELTVIKLVDNTLGGSAVPADFDITVTNNTTVMAPFPGANGTGTTVTLDVGTYSVSEENDPDYTGTVTAGVCSGPAELDGIYSCTITNTFDNVVAPVVTADLTITKVINGTNVPAGTTPTNFSFLGVVAGDSLDVTPFDPSGTVVIEDVPVGAVFSIFESYPGMDWDVSYTLDGVSTPGACTAMMTANGASCVITNTYDRVTGSITIVKEFADTNGLETATNFDFKIDNSPVAEGVPVTGLTQDSYSVNEVWNPNHFAAFPTDTATTLDQWYDITVDCIETNSGTNLGVTALGENFDLSAGDDIVCTITNDQKSAGLTVTKSINGGPVAALASDFGFTVTGSNVVVDGVGVPAPSVHFQGNASLTGTVITLDAGAFTLSEDIDTDYLSLITPECEGGILFPGEIRDCDVVNTFVGTTANNAFIQGIIYSDTDGNGQNNEGAAGRMSGVTVTLYDSAYAPLQSMTSGTATATSGSVVSGQYRFRELAAGSYHVCVQDMNATAFDQTSPEVGYKEPLLNSSSNVTTENDPAVSGQFCYEVDLIQDQQQRYVRFGFEPVPALPPMCVPGNLVTNGGFESPEITSANEWEIFPTGTAGLAWDVIQADGNPVSTGLEIQEGYGDWTPSEGNQFAELDADWPTAISQTLTTVPGVQYIFALDFSPRPGTAADDNGFTVKADGVLLDTVTALTVGADTTWTTYNYPFTATSSATLIEIIDAGVISNSLGSFIDDVAVYCGDRPAATGTLEVIVNVQNDEDPTVSADDFTVRIADDNGNQDFQGQEAGVDRSVIGDYVASILTDTTGYEVDYTDDCDGTMTAGGFDICVITLEFVGDDVDPAPTLPVQLVTPCLEAGAPGRLVAHFGYENFNSTSVFIPVGIDNLFLGDSSMVFNPAPQITTFLPGTYDDAFTVDFDATLSVQWTLDWTMSDDEGDTMVVNANTSFCTPQHDHTLTVYKVVINDNGGTAVAGDFTLDIQGNNPSQTSVQGSEDGVAVTMGVGDYSVTEAPVPGYFTHYEDDCTGTIQDETRNETCRVTNDDLGINGTITVNLEIINDNGGSLVAGDVELFVNGLSVENGVMTAFTPSGYTVTRTPTPGYDNNLSGDCDGSGNLTVTSGNHSVCTITLNDSGNPGAGGGVSSSGGGSTPPPGQVLGDTDEVPTDDSDDADSADNTDTSDDNAGAEDSDDGEVLVPAPTPIVLGDSDEQLPRTGVPVAGLLALGSVLTFLVRRKQD